MRLVDIMIHRKINFLCIQETKWVAEKAKNIDSLCFKFMYLGRRHTRNDVDVIIDKSLKDNVVKINKIIALKVVDNKIFNFVSAYAPQIGLDIGSIEKFWNDLEELILMIHFEERIFNRGDLNGRVRRVVEEFRNIYGEYGFGGINEESRNILDFILTFDFIIANILF